MTEKNNGQQNYETQTTDKERKHVYLRRRIALGGAALAATTGLLLGASHTLHEFKARSDKQLEIEQRPTLQDQIFDAIENYDANLPQVQYEIAPDSNISQQAEVAAELLREQDENLTYAKNHQALALTAAKMTARDIEAITGRGVQAGDPVTTWYDFDLESFVTAATQALPSKD